jgi:hypothetical protein
MTPKINLLLRIVVLDYGLGRNSKVIFNCFQSVPLLFRLRRYTVTKSFVTQLFSYFFIISYSRATCNIII